MSQCIQVVTTVDSRDKAIELARELVLTRLAACVQIDGPIESFYHWNGKLEQSIEWRCTAKSFHSVLVRLQDSIRRIHPYETPEIVTLAMSDVSPDYLQWMKDNVDL